MPDSGLENQCGRYFYKIFPENVKKMKFTKYIWFQPGSKDPKNSTAKPELCSYCGNGSTYRFKPWKRSNAKDQERIQEHISHKSKKIGHQRRPGVSFKKSGESQVQEGKNDQSAGDQHIRSGRRICFRVCQIKKSDQRIKKYNTCCSN